MKFKATASVFAGVAFSQALAVLIAYLTKPITIISVNPNGSVTAIINDTATQVPASNITSRMVVQSISPFGLGPLGSLLVSAGLVVGSLVAAFALVYLLRKGYMSYVIAVLLGVATFLLNYYMLAFALGYSSAVAFVVPLLFAGFIAAYALYPARFRGLLLALANVLVLLNGAELGFFLGVSFQRLTVIFLAFLFSAYDFYSVFRGPISRMLGRPSARPSGQEEAVARPERSFLGPMMVNFGEVEMGLGDITFYSMMPTAVYAEGLGLPLTLLEVLLIDVGVGITLLLLRKIRPLPGLPVPLILGVLVFLARPRERQKLNGALTRDIWSG